MEENKDSSIETIVSLSTRCEKKYKKLVKKCNPKLLKMINDNIDKLETNPKLGEELSQDLEGLRSIHINQFHFRIVYELEECNPRNKIIVHVIAHRKDVYSELATYLGR